MLSIFSQKELKRKLSKDQFLVTQKNKTEKPFLGKYYNYYESGIYNCVVCQNKLFCSDAKYDSGTGWPSFTQSYDSSCLNLLPDKLLKTNRIEARCRNCNAYLGYVFNDGPVNSGGKRFCINSIALKFKNKI